MSVPYNAIAVPNYAVFMGFDVGHGTFFVNMCGHVTWLIFSVCSIFLQDRGVLMQVGP